MLSKETRGGDVLGGEVLSSSPLTMTFPRRDVMEETLRGFSLNPFGFFPKAAFWRQIGMSGSRDIADSALHGWVVSGAILPPDDLWGVPRGYLPGPRLFTAGLRIPPIPGLSATPDREEIQRNSCDRVLQKVADALVYERGKPTMTRLCAELVIDLSHGTPLINGLITEGFVERQGPLILPTEKMQELLACPDLISRVRGESIGGPLKEPSRHRILKARRAEGVAEIRAPLVAFIRENNGSTATELFKHVSKNLLPADITRPMFETMLSTLVKEKALVTDVKRFGPVLRQVVYKVPR
jgi:hypothetical protein